MSIRRIVPNGPANLAQDPFRLEVGRRDEIGGPLHRDLKMLDLAEVTPQPARRLIGGTGHDVDYGGPGRHGLYSLSFEGCGGTG